MKAYRITYLRVGGKEMWAGWRIAAMSQGVSGNALDAYRNLQAANSSIEILMEHYDNASVIYEFEFVRGNVFFSKLTYGIKDKIGRASMRADGLVVPFAENPGLFKDISSLFAVSDNVFDNEIAIDKDYLDLVNKNGDLSSFTEKDIVNTLDSVEINSTDDRDGYIFANQSIKEQVITAMFWAIMNKSGSTLWLIADLSTAEKLNLISEIFSYLPYSLRAKAMFHTSTVNPKKPVKLELCDTRPKMGYYIDLKTGENNLKMLTKRVSEYSFVSHILSLPDKTARNDYFEKLNKKMAEIESVISDNMGIIQTAHVLVMDESANPEELSDTDLVKKLHSSLQITPVNNAVDSFCADLIKRIIDRKIVIQQDFVYEKISERFVVTLCPDFIEYGSTIIAEWLWRSPNKYSSYEYLSKLENNRYKALESKLLLNSDSAGFVESYYLDWKGSQLDCSDDLETCLDSISGYIKSAEHLPQTNKIRKKAADMYIQAGGKIIERYYEDEIDLSSAVPMYLSSVRENLSEYFPKIKSRLYERFWENFDIQKFEIDQIPNYDVMRDNSRKSRFMSSVIRRFKEIYIDNKSETSVVSELKKTIKENCDILKNEATVKILTEFQNCCLLNIENNDHIDFWYSVSALSERRFLEFILFENLPVFTNSSIFMQQISIYRKNSTYFKHDEKLIFLRDSLDSFIDENKKDKNRRNYVETAVEMYEIVENEIELREEIVKAHSNKLGQQKNRRGFLGKFIK